MNEITVFSTKFESLRFRFAGIVSTLKFPYATFGMQNGVEGAFNRQNITIRKEITEFSSKFEILRFAICRDCFDAEIGVRYVGRVECRAKSV
jgi:hypothetical protein